MNENLISKKNSIVAGVVLIAIIGFGYAGYSFLQGLNSETSSARVDASLFNPELRAFYNVKDKIKLTKKDMLFTEKPFYKNLEDNTVEFPPAVPSGRPNPFWAP